MAHGGVIRGRKEKTEPGLAQTVFARFGIEIDFDAQLLQHIGSAGARGHIAIAVLGYGHATGGDNEGRGGGHIQRAQAVATRPAEIDGVFRRADRLHRRPHRAHCPDNFLHCGFAHGERCEERGHACLRHLAEHDGREGTAGFFRIEPCSAHKALQRGGEFLIDAHAGTAANARASVRKFCSSA